jgi:hypothetical protein
VTRLFAPLPACRIKRRYFAFLKEAKRYSETSLDGVAKALSRFEAYTRYKEFKAFHIEQVIGFQRHLAEQVNLRTKERLSKATLYATLVALKNFFTWLAGQSGYRSRLTYADAEYFNLSDKETRVAKAHRNQRVPTLEQIEHVIRTMPIDGGEGTRTFGHGKPPSQLQLRSLDVQSVPVGGALEVARLEGDASLTGRSLDVKGQQDCCKSKSMQVHVPLPHIDWTQLILRSFSVPATRETPTPFAEARLWNWGLVAVCDAVLVERRVAEAVRETRWLMRGKGLLVIKLAVGEQPIWVKDDGVACRTDEIVDTRNFGIGIGGGGFAQDAAFRHASVHSGRFRAVDERLLRPHPIDQGCEAVDLVGMARTCRQHSDQPQENSSHAALLRVAERSTGRT